MIITSVKFFRALLILGGLFLFAVPSARAQLTEDAKVDIVQSHFHFKNLSTGQDLSHGVLKIVLQIRKSVV